MARGWLPGRAFPNHSRAGPPSAARRRAQLLGRYGQHLLVIGPQHEDLTGSVLQDPGDVLGPEAGVVVRRGGDDDAVKPLVIHRLAHGVTVGTPALDAGIDRDPEFRGPPFD